jgi:thiamine transport system ATP-binding protein
MLDEPLGALDRSLRTRLLDELAGLFRTIALSIIYVTHDQEEALAVGDRVAVLNRGRLEALLPARELWLAPPNEFVARFLGLGNIAPLATARDHLVTPWGEIVWSGSIPRSGATQLLIRPEALALSDDGPLTGVVTAVSFRGESTTIFVRPTDSANGPILEAHLNSANRAMPQIGADVTLSVDPSGLLFLP